MGRWNAWTVVVAALAAAVLAVPVANAARSSAAPTISLGADGETAAVFSYADAIRERVFVPVPGVDQDGDGVVDRVAIDVMRPAETEQGLKVPAIVLASPYFTSIGVTPETQFLHTSADGVADSFPDFYDNYFVPRGYAVVLAEANGTGFSTGCPLHGGPGDIASMKAVVDWLQGRVPGYDASGNAVAATWENGKTAMIGKSYNGTLPNGVAATGVQGLTTIVPISGISNWYDYSRSNGIRFNTHYPSSLSRSIVQNRSATDLGVVPPDRQTLCAGTRTTLDGEDGDATGDMNDFWAARNYVSDVSNVTAAVFMTFGLNDDNVKTDQLAPWWQGLAANNVPRKLWLSEDGHVDPFDFRRDAWVDTLHRWFDYWLQGVPNGIMSEPMVSIERGPGVWEDDADWPLPGTSDVDVYLQGTTAGAAGGFGDSSGGAQPTLTFTDAPSQREPAMINTPTGSQANRLVFLSPPLAQDVHISGTPRVDLRASFNKADGHLGAILVDYSDSPFATPKFGIDGVRTGTTRTCWGDSTALDSACYLDESEGTTDATSWRVAKGILDAENRDSLFSPTPLVPGTAYDFRLPLLPNDYVFPAGHRVGVVLVSNYLSYPEVTDQSSPTAVVTVDTRQTRLVLPVVGGSSAAEAAGMFGDSTAPTLHLPTPPDVEASAPATPVTYAVSADDDRDPSPAVDCTPPSGSGFAVGATTVDCTATDASGNTATGSFAVTVRDTTAPTLDLPTPAPVEATGAVGAQLVYDATASDRADPSPAVSCSPASGSAFPVGTTTVSCTATDASGNRSAGSFDVTVVDTTVPALSLPDAKTVEADSAAGAVVTYDASASDAVDRVPAVDCAPASGTTFALGETTVHCTAADAAGNVARGTFVVTVADTTPPLLHLPDPIRIEAASGAGTVVRYTATATDTVDAAPSVSCTPSTAATFGVGVTTVTCMARDASGNSGTGSFTVTVVDTTPPTIHLPSSLSVAATSGAGATVDYTATATDAVDAVPTLACVPASGSTFPLGTTTVHCTAKDRSGNESAASFPVIVGDSAPPALSLPRTVTVDARVAKHAIVRYVVTAQDAVDPAPRISCVPPSGSAFRLGRTVVQCTATDAAGNTAHGSFVVQVTGASVVVRDLRRHLPKSKHARKLTAELAAIGKLVVAGRSTRACRALRAFTKDVRLVRAGRAARLADVRRLARSLRC